MELPRLIEIGEKNIGDFGKFLNSLNKPKKSFFDSWNKCSEGFKEKN